MTVSSLNRLAGPYLGTGAVTVYPFTFEVFQGTDLLLQQVDTSGNITTLNYNVDYTVALSADQINAPGGNITLTLPLAINYNLVIASQVSALQLTNLTQNGGFFPAVITTALDKLTILIQQNLNKITRAIQIPLADVGINVTLPVAAVRANMALVFDSLGNIMAGTLASIPVNAVLNTFLQSSTLAAARAALGLPVFGTLATSNTVLGNLATQNAGLGIANNGLNATALSTGQCQLVYVSPTQIILYPKRGNLIQIAGQVYAIPAAGISAANTNVYVNGSPGQTLVTGQTYYVSIGVIASVLTLFFHQVVGAGYSHGPDTTAGNIGVEVLYAGGPASFASLVGMVYIYSSPVGFCNSLQIRGVRSWFNRQPQRGFTYPGSAFSTTSGTPVELSTAYRTYAVTFADDIFVPIFNGGAANNTAGAGCYTWLGFNGAANTTIVQPQGVYDINYYAPIHESYPVEAGYAGVAEGFNFVTLYGSVTGGTGTWNIYSTMCLMIIGPGS